jgi:predicted transcriptional regulator
MHLTTQQLKAARALLEWTQENLAEKAGISLATVRRLEAIPGPIKGTAATMVSFVEALEAAGVELIGPDKEGQVGVVLKGRRNPENTVR